MKAPLLKLLLAASLLVNAGVVAAVWLKGAPVAAIEGKLFGMRHAEVPDHLRLDAAQRERWHALEKDFVAALRESGGRIDAHRDRMVREILAERPDAAAIERERAAIFALQEAQQQSVIAQLLKEGEMLRPEQRAALADLLLAQAPAAGPH